MEPQHLFSTGTKFARDWERLLPERKDLGLYYAREYVYLNRFDGEVVKAVLKVAIWPDGSSGQQMRYHVLVATTERLLMVDPVMGASTAEAFPYSKLRAIHRKGAQLFLVTEDGRTWLTDRDTVHDEHNARLFQRRVRPVWKLSRLRSWLKGSQSWTVPLLVAFVLSFVQIALDLI